MTKYFHHIEIVSEKKASDYTKLLKHLDIKAEEFVMIGNSLKSDVLPVLELGAYGIHVPFHTTWAHEQVDVIITDPPRAGMHEKLVQKILEIGAPRVVYVSCNPATQARDLQLLDPAYQVTAIQPVDMFPHTHHIENVVQLTYRNL